MRRPQSSIALLMIIMAIVLALGVFLMISIIYQRADLPEQATQPEGQSAYVVQVGNEQVALQVDPNQRPVIVNTPVPAEPQTAELPTATPDPAAVASAVPAAASSADVTTFGGGGQPTTDRIIFISYQVQAGDTLFRIQTNQVTSIALMARFGISASDIVVGNVLSLPVGDPNACGDWRPYVVLQGDTAFGISQASGITLQELQARNGLDANYAIFETQVICVP